MAEKVKEAECLAPGLEHAFEFVIAAHGYQCFVCRLCGYPEDVTEDSQP